MGQEELAYLPCPNRLVGTVKGVVTHVRCNDPSSVRYGQLVQPVHCQRCLTGPEAGQGVREADTAEVPKPDAQPDRDSAASPPATPGLVRRALSYAEAVIEWTAAGRPERSDKEVERIFAHFCKPCRWFDRHRQICRGCGCRVANNGYAVVNKIKMATEHCPRKLW
jgi:hypothetical protein